MRLVIFSTNDTFIIFLPDYALPSHGEREEWSAETDRGVRKIGKDRHEGSMSLKAKEFQNMHSMLLNALW